VSHSLFGRVLGVDELSTKYHELTRIREELDERLKTTRDDEQLARANVKATEQANCESHLCNMSS